MEPELQEHDYLLELSGSDFSLNATTESQKRAPSFNNLVDELWTDGQELMDVQPDIQRDFALDCETTEAQLKHWQSPATDAAFPYITATSSPCAPDQTMAQLAQSITACSTPCTLERPVLMTQLPQQPPREGATRESVPHLPSEVLPSAAPTPAMPALQVLRMGSCAGSAAAAASGTLPGAQLQLPTLNVTEIGMLLEELNDTPMTEVSQPCDRFTIVTLQQADGSLAELALSPLFRAEMPRVAPRKAVKRSPISTDDADVDEKVKFIQEAVKRFHSHGAAVCSNGKTQVHELVLVLLLAKPHPVGLANILTFCTEDGVPTGDVCDNFLARDTRAVGLIWQRIKGNKCGNYDTFARAMRVGRERHMEYFDYLDAGKGSKKRIYKLGPKCRRELDRMKKVLVQLEDEF